VSDSPDESDDVTRLIDMVVEEVSLVDRAANQRRFLLVKRSDVMSDEPSQDDDLHGGADGADDAALPADLTDGEGGPAPAGASEPTAAAPRGASTEAVVAALEALTGVVEVLASQHLAKAKKPAAPPVDDEEDVADGGLDEADEEDDAPDAPPPRRRAPPPPKKQTKAQEGALADVRAQLARIELAVGRRPPPTPAPPAANPITDRLAEIAKMLGALKAQVAGQAGRLTKVEKNVGVPASAPLDGARPKAPDDVSWPLDINAPQDRASVAKDVSFH
jgi:hypothetical protein